MPKHLEASEHRLKVLEEAGFELANPKLRDAVLEELENCNQEGIPVHVQLNGWKVAPANDPKM